MIDKESDRAFDDLVNARETFMKNHNKRMKELNSILKNLEDDEEMTNDSIKNIECLEKEI